MQSAGFSVSPAMVHCAQGRLRRPWAGQRRRGGRRLALDGVWGVPRCGLRVTRPASGGGDSCSPPRAPSPRGQRLRRSRSISGMRHPTRSEDSPYLPRYGAGEFPTSTRRRNLTSAPRVRVCTAVHPVLPAIRPNPGAAPSAAAAPRRPAPRGPRARPRCSRAPRSIPRGPVRCSAPDRIPGRSRCRSRSLNRSG